MEKVDDRLPQVLEVKMPSILKAAIDKVPEEMRTISIRKLKSVVNPDKTVHRLRTAFWIEYYKAGMSGRRVVARNIYEGICDESYFYRDILKDPLQVAWIMKPPTEYLVGLEVALNDAMEQISDAMFEGRIVDDEGNINPQALNAVTRTLEVLHAIVRGPIVQKIETKSMNVNVNTTSQDIPTDHAEIMRQLAIHEKEKQPIDVTDLEQS